MPSAIPIVLWSWLPVSMLLFWRLPPARASVVCLVGGWLFLPTAWFDASAAVEFPYWIMPACLPSDYWTTKARVIGVALLLGVMAFDPRAWRRLRPSWFDLPMLGWCLCPIASGLANGLGPAGAIADSAYLFLAWGVPYLAGRLYFSDLEGLEALARGIVAGGLAYLPLCAIEFAVGPRLYAWCYGFHPYRTQGMVRYVGYRPIVFLEDGNQLGIWVAASALTASWLWWSGRLSRFWGMPGWLVASSLVAQSLLSQSVGAVSLLIAGLVAMEAMRRLGHVWPLGAVAVVLLLLLAARAANMIDAKALAMSTGLGRRLVDSSIKADRSSFGWRLRVEERAARVALQRPLLGWGRWDWWRAGLEGERPWGLVSLVFGNYGVIGWAMLLGCFAAPIAKFLGLGPPRSWAGPSMAWAASMAGSLAIIGLDAILNPCLLLPFSAVAGGLIGLDRRGRPVTAPPLDGVFSFHRWIGRGQPGEGRGSWR